VPAIGLAADRRVGSSLGAGHALAVQILRDPLRALAGCKLAEDAARPKQKDGDKALSPEADLMIFRFGSGADAYRDRPLADALQYPESGLETGAIHSDHLRKNALAPLLAR
jgi:hypothetical protein